MLRLELSEDKVNKFVGSGWIIIHLILDAVIEQKE